ncbi:MAG: hypothetical protein ACYCZO_06120, partial [Daejeonella sp.]
AKVLRQSPGLKVEMKSKSTNRVYPTLQGTEKLTALLIELNKKKKAEVITTSAATFSATLYGSTYSCIVDFMDVTGNKDFYLVNENTWVFTYIGSSSEAFANFAVTKPSMYGSYSIWIEGPNGSGFSNALYLGDPYTGVSTSNGMLQFTDNNAADAIYSRLEAAYEAHQVSLFDAYDSLTDEQMDAHALSQGYDEWLPFKEFEAYFGLSSLRQAYQAQVDAYNANTNSAICNPRTAFVVDDEVFQTMLTSGGQLGINGTVLTKAVSKPLICSTKTCIPRTGCYDDNDSVVDDTVGNIIVEKIIRLRERQTSNWFPAVIRAKAKAKVIIHKITGASSRRPYSTKMSVRLYGEAFDGISEYITNSCGSSIGGYDTGFNALRRRFQRRENNKWNNIRVLIPDCGIFAEYNLPTYGMFYHRM